MPEIITKTTGQMDPVADIEEDDELLVSRGGVIGVSTVAAVRTALGERLAEEFADEDLGVALAAAQISTDNAAATAANAATASAAADRAVLAAASRGSYPNSAATVVPKGVTAVVLSGGTGYTDGVDYVGTFTGGGGSGARFLYDVVAGVPTNVHGIEPGYGYTSNPTPVGSAPAGSGFAGTATASHLVLSGQFYFAASADAATERMYQNVAGVATAVVPAIIRPYAGQVPATIGTVTSILWSATPEFTVTGLGQKFRGLAPAANGAGQLQIATAGLFAGAYTPVILPSGEAVPQSALKANYPIEYTPAVIGGTNYLILTFPAVLPDAQTLRLEWMGALAFTHGSIKPAAGATLTGATSGVTAVVTSVPDLGATGTFGGGDRAGTLYVKAPAAFVAGEDLQVAGVTNMKAGGPVSTSAATVARIANPNQKYPADLIGPEMLLKVPHGKSVGSASLQVFANDGVTQIIPATPMRAADDTTTLVPAGLYAAHDTLRLIKNAASRINLVAAPDLVTPALSRSLGALDEFGLLPSPIRPIAARRSAPSLIPVEQYIHADRLDDPTQRNDDDRVRAVLCDMGPFQNVAFSPTLNSVFARLDGRNIHFANHQFHDLIGAIIADTGHVPSINDTVPMLGEQGLTVNPTNFSIAGPGHNHETPLSWSLKGTTNDASTGNVDVVSAELKDLPVGPLFYGDKLESVYTGFYTTPSGKIALHATRTLTFESASGHDVRNLVVLDFTHASVNCVPGVAAGGYAGMLALRGRVNRLCPYIDGVPQAVRTIGLRDGSTLNLGNAERIEVWHDSQPEARLVFTNNAGGSGDGAGWSHWEDTGGGWVKVARQGPVQLVNSSWGQGKIYFGMYESQIASKDMTGIKVKTDFSTAVAYGPNPAL